MCECASLAGRHRSDSFGSNQSRRVKKPTEGIAKHNTHTCTCLVGEDNKCFFFKQKERNSAQIWGKKRVCIAMPTLIHQFGAERTEHMHTEKTSHTTCMQLGSYTAEVAGVNTKLLHCNAVEGINTPASVI